MEDVARLDVAPDDVRPLAFARQQADARGVFRIPAIGEALARDERRHREGDGQVHDDDVVLGDHAVVDRRAVLYFDRLVAADFSVGPENRVPDRGRITACIADRMHLAGIRIKVRMGRERLAERAVEIREFPRLELFRDFGGIAAGFDDGEDLASMADDIGVRAATAAWTRDRRFAQRFADGRRADPAVAIPQRLAVLDAQAVQHGVADEPVVRRRVRHLQRVRSIAEIDAVEASGDRARHLQVGESLLVLEGRVDAGEVGVRFLGAAHRAIEVGDTHYAGGDDAANGGFNGAGHGVFPL